ncbi:MAG TPA: putative Fe-S cluster assembly protein SufT [Verrucomicrobiae bacterium]|nr:putative Fe-S cluster assembly protein SufT [Verrucomicrobiae bacterium]
MHQPPQTVALTRDVIGTLIPAGTQVELPGGTAATITQALGGSYTIQVEGHLFRIEGKDADVLGKEPTRGPAVPDNATDADLEKAVWDQLRTVYDPEIPINVVELGLIYEAKLEPTSNGKRKANIRMTLTAPGCGMGEVLVADAKSKVLQIPGIAEAEVQLTFDPPWTQDMMSEAARLQTGMM